MKNFRVIQCPSCGNVQVSQTSSTFKCFRCGKSRTFNPKSQLGLGVKILASFDTGEQAAKFVQEYQRVKHDL
jgi:hypothetical protein